ncbi:MAG: hypothetical protein H7A46_19015 [Verrucomicrobiales bacterium]|nr:hypothetical protein [Verrucomicrobiales bacterium]
MSHAEPAVEVLRLLVLTVGMTCGCLTPAAQDLARYASCDLRNLSTNEVRILQSEFKQKTGIELGEKWGWFPFAPWLLASFEADSVSWVFAEVYPGYDIPDVSAMKLHFFDKSWGGVCSHTVPTGYRFFLNDVTVQRKAELDRPLVVVRATSTGPSIVTSPGQEKSLFEQGDYQLQYYTLIGASLFMVRLEDNHGAVARNHYRWESPLKGPPVPTRSKDEWIEWLDSPDVAHRLSALVWLTGFHRPSSEPRGAHSSQEPLAQSKRFESVRDDPRTAAILRRLKRDENLWVRDYASLGLLRGDDESK